MVAGERPGAAELARNQADVGKVLHRFHAHEGIVQRVARGDDPMVGEQDRVVINNQRLNAGRNVGRGQLTPLLRAVSQLRHFLAGRSGGTHHLSLIHI